MAVCRDTILENPQESIPFTIPSILDVDDDQVISINDILNFTTVAPNTILEDMNKFLMKDNTFYENFLSSRYGLVNTYNIRKLSIDNDVYEANTFSFVEAMDMFGSIHSDKATSTGSSNLLEFSVFFLEDPSVAEFDKYKELQYSSAPLYIQGVIYLDGTSITFDNNYFTSFGNTGYATAVVVEAQAISIVYSKGNLFFGDLIIKNCNGIDASRISQILGTEKSVNIKVNEFPDEINYENGEIVSAAELPEYYIDYKTTTYLINFYTPDRPVQGNIANSLWLVHFSQLKLSNLTHSSNQVIEKPFVADFGPFIKYITIEDLQATDIDCFD